MKSYEWDPAERALVEVDDPTYHLDASDVQTAIHDAGYVPELSSEGENDAGAMVVVYKTECTDKPRYFIDISGQNSGLASLVARDFPSLVETLRHIHPLLTLIGLDQFSSARISDHLERKERERARQR